jgi:hypothetical protein
MLRIYSRNALRPKSSPLAIPLFRACSVEVLRPLSHSYLHIGTAQSTISLQSSRLSKSPASSTGIVSLSRSFHATRRSEGWHILLATLKVRRRVPHRLFASADAADRSLLSSSTLYKLSFVLHSRWFLWHCFASMLGAGGCASWIDTLINFRSGRQSVLIW